MLNIINDMKKILPAECIHDDPALIDVFSIDASFYKPKAKLVVDANNMDDLSNILEVCRRHNIGLSFRGSGTGLNGQTCGEGVTIRLQGTFWQSLQILNQGKAFWAGCRVIGGDVNKGLASYQRKLAADPASINAACMGGIVANNAAGMCCMVNQNIYSTLQGMRLMLADGTFLDTTDEKSVTFFRKSHKTMLDSLLKLREKIIAKPDVVKRIKRKYSIKNTIGYNVNSFIDFEDPLDILMHLMVGSEGTLGFIHEVLVRTHPNPPLRATGLFFFPSLIITTEAIIQLKENCKAEASELLDYICLQALQNVKDMPDIIHDLEKGSCALLIETKAWDEDELKINMDKIIDVLSKFPLLSEPSMTTNQEECEKLWNVRRNLFPVVANFSKPEEFVLTEDINIPVPKLAEACQAFQNLFDKYGYNAGILGHAFHGNLHFTIPVNLSIPENVKNLHKFTEDLVEIITKRYDGSLKAEHGTGRSMAPFVRCEWGDFLYEIMCEVKKLFDPQNIINPGVLLNENKEDYLDGLKTPVPINSVVDMCIECGFCDLACPARDIALSPRQRISMARSIKKFRMDGEEDKADKWEKVFEAYGEQMCATDGLCTLRCPLGSDVASMIRDYRADHASTMTKRTANYAANHFRTVLKTASMTLNGMSLAHRIVGDKVMEGITGSARTLSRGKLPAWNKAMPKGGSLLPVTNSNNEKADTVVYFPSCAVRSMGQSKGDASEPLMNVTLKLLKRAGYNVVFPKNISGLCCGKAMETKGLQDQADAKSRELEKALLAASNNGKYMVLCDTSPCLARMKKNLDDRLVLMDPIEFAMSQLVNKLNLRKLNRTVALHPTCSTRSMGLTEQFFQLASMCAEGVVIPTGINCCGFAGDKGFHNPELNASALSSLKNQISECHEGYSVSRTCEVGLTLHGDKNYRNILYLVEEASR